MAIFALSLGACASSPADDAASSSDDLAAEARRKPKYPAFTPDAPRLVSLGGPVLAAPRVQVVTFAGDPLADDVETFAARLGASDYWRRATSEYGVGPMTALPPIRLAETPPASIDDADFGPWLASKLGAAPFGAPDASTVYAVFYPAGTRVTIGTLLTGCVDSGGYHWDTPIAGVDVPYVVIPRCAQLGDVSGLDELTMVASHELAEAATDPLSRTNPAFRAIDADHAVFDDYYEAEDGDLCVQDRYLTATPSDVGSTVQRLWSNAAAAAGHDPCVPSSGAYFNAQPVLTQSITAGKLTTRGVAVPLGQSRTIDLRLYSDAPTSGAWSVAVYDVATVRGTSAELAFTLDRSAGINGDTLRLTIRRTQHAARGASTAMVWSQLDGRSSFWPFFVSE